MNNDLLTICIVNYNSADFILNTLYCLEKITKNKYKVIIRDNNSKIKDFKKLKRETQNYSNVFLYRINDFTYTGSIAHGIALNDLLNRIDSSYGVILDADCTFLYKDWDEVLINRINNEYPVIGTPASYTEGEKRSGDFPLMYGILFITKVLKEFNIDFRPKHEGVYKDTGYTLKDYLIEHNYKGKILEEKNTRFIKSGPFSKIICVEYYLEGHEKIFACHFGRGSSLGRGKYLSGKKKSSFYFIPIIGNFLLKLKGKREKKLWIKICKEIVDNFD